MGYGVEKEPPSKRKPRAGVELEEGDDDCTLLSLINAKRPRQGRKKEAEAEAEAEAAPAAAKGGGDAEGFGDTLACFRKKLLLKAPKRDKVGATEAVGKEEEPPVFAEEEAGDARSEKPPRKGRTGASVPRKKKKNENDEIASGGDRKADGDSEDSLFAMMRKAKQRSIGKRKKRVSCLLGPAEGTVQRDNEFAASEQVEDMLLPEVGNAETFVSDSRVARGELLDDVGIVDDEMVGRSLQDVVGEETTLVSGKEQPGVEEPLGTLCCSPRCGDDRVAVSRDESSLVSETERELPVRCDRDALGGQSRESAEIPLRDGCAEQGGEEAAKIVASSLYRKSPPLKDGHLDGRSCQMDGGSSCCSLLITQASAEKSGKVPDKNLDAQPTSVPDHESLDNAVQVELYGNAMQSVERMVESSEGLVHSAVGVSSGVISDFVKRCSFVHTTSCTEESASAEDVKNYSCVERSRLNDGEDPPEKMDLEHNELKESGNFDVRSTTCNSRDLDMIDANIESDVNNEEKKCHRVTRGTRKAKKYRHIDMAYEGDADWENLMGDQVSPENATDGERPARTRIRNGSQTPVTTDAHNGRTAAVISGLKARSAGPIERIKFKDLLKRKGGLQEYLECRNFILGLWHKDVRRILTMEDCGITTIPSDKELPQSSLIRDIYLFLDSNGCINTGVASDRDAHIYRECLAEPPEDKILDQTWDNDTVDFKDAACSVPCLDTVYETTTVATNNAEYECGLKEVKVESKHEIFHDPTANVGCIMDCKKHTQLNLKVEVQLCDREECHQHVSTTVSGSCNLVPAKQEIDCRTAMVSKDHLSPIMDKNIYHNLDAAKVQIARSPSSDVSVVDAFQTNSSTHISRMNHDTKLKAEGYKKIIVIGAGPAGLTAARHLQRHGFHVTLLEARGRIGGRVHTDCTSLSVPVDLGASIITGTEADIVAERRPDLSSLICTQLGIELTVLGGDCPLYDVATGEKVPKDVDVALEAEYNSLINDVVALNSENGGDSLSLEEGLEYALKKLRIDCSTSGAEAPFVSEITENGLMQYTESSSICKESGSTKKGEGSNGIVTDKKMEDSSNKHVDVLSSLERRVMDWHFAHLEYGCAASLKDVSLLHWNQDDIYGGFGGPHCMIKGGFRNVVESLGNGINIHLNHVVTEITHSTSCESGSQVNVVTSNGKQFIGNAALITVPLGCLKANSIKFSPALPDWKLSSIQRLGFGVLNKVILEFPDVFWDDTVDFFGATAEETGKRGQCFMFWNVKKTVGAPVLIALVAGKAAVLGQNWGASDHVNHALMILRKLFGETSVSDPVASVVTNWEKDPFSRGAYSYVAVGASGEDYDILGRPVSNCLFFAGEATCKEHPDTVGGAMLSGLREAVRIIDIFNTGNDYMAEVEAMEAAQKQAKNERNEVRDFVKRLESSKLSSIPPRNTLDDTHALLTKEALLQDMFANAKTIAGRLHLAKELLRLPVGRLKSFAGTKEGLSVLNSWILDSLGKDATQLLRLCVRLLVLVSTDLLAVRLSGIGKTVKDKVCVHTSRDIRAIASQLVNVWIEVFRKEKASNGGLKALRKTAASDSSKIKSKGHSSAELHLNRCETSNRNGGLPGSCRNSEAWKTKADPKLGLKSEVKSSCSDGAKPELEFKGVDIKAATKAARAAAMAAAELHASSEADCHTFRELPKIPSFHKFAKREQYPEMDDFDFRRRKWSGGTLGRQDCLSEIDSRNCRVREWSVDFSAANTNLNGSRNSADYGSQWNYSNEIGNPHSLLEHSGDSGAVDSRMRKAWVDTDGVGSGGVKDYTAIERWQSEAMDADAEFLYSMNLRDEEDSNKFMGKYHTFHDGSCASQATESASLSEGHHKVQEGSCASQPGRAERIKQAVIDYVASLLMPLYKTRKIDKEGYKLIMKKSTTKVMDQCTEAEKMMAVPEFLDFRRKNKIRAFVDKLIERQMAMNQQNVKP